MKPIIPTVLACLLVANCCVGQEFESIPAPEPDSRVGTEVFVVDDGPQPTPADPREAPADAEVRLEPTPNAVAPPNLVPTPSESIDSRPSGFERTVGPREVNPASGEIILDSPEGRPFVVAPPRDTVSNPPIESVVPGLNPTNPGMMDRPVPGSETNARRPSSLGGNSVPGGMYTQRSYSTNSDRIRQVRAQQPRVRVYERVDAYGRRQLVVVEEPGVTRRPSTTAYRQVAPARYQYVAPSLGYRATSRAAYYQSVPQQVQVRTPAGTVVLPASGVIAVPVAPQPVPGQPIRNFIRRRW